MVSLAIKVQLLFNKMVLRATIYAIRQYSQNPLAKIQQIIIIDEQVQIKHISKRVQKYQKKFQKIETHNNTIDLDDEISSFAYIFGVPKIPDMPSSSSESDNENESNDVQLPYKHHSNV